MKKNQPQNPDPSFISAPHHPEYHEEEFPLYISHGINFSDIYMDLQEVAIELKICKCVITNMHKAGKRSYTL